MVRQSESSSRAPAPFGTAGHCLTREETFDIVPGTATNMPNFTTPLAVPSGWRDPLQPNPTLQENRMRRRVLFAGAVLGALLTNAGSLQAQGSMVMTHSSCATAMAGTGVAAPCHDGSAVLFQPAGLATQSSVIGVGWTGITTSGNFTYDFTGQRIERKKETSSVPFGFASYRINDRFAAGIGVFAPYGLHIDWPVCPVTNSHCASPNFEGRFVSYDTKLKNIYIQPTVAMQATNWLSLGVGLDVVKASIDLNQRGDVSEVALPPALSPFPGATFAAFGVPSGTDFVDAHLTGDGTAVTFNVGALARVSERVSLGVRYLHKAKINYTGDAEFTQIKTGFTLPNGLPLDAALAAQFLPDSALANQGVKTSLTLPAQFVVGIAVRPVEMLNVRFDYWRTGWSVFDSTLVDFQGNGRDAPLVLDYQNTNTYRLGAEYLAMEKLALRAGFSFNTAAEKDASVSPLLPEAERNYYTAGLGYRLPRGFGVDVGYQLVKQSDRRGRVRGRTNTAQAAEQLNVGVYHADAHILNATVSYHFGRR